MAFCGKCGNQVPEGINFCGQCGAPLSSCQSNSAPQSNRTKSTSFLKVILILGVLVVIFLLIVSIVLFTFRKPVANYFRNAIEKNSTATQQESGAEKPPSQQTAGLPSAFVVSDNLWSILGDTSISRYDELTDNCGSFSLNLLPDGRKTSVVVYWSPGKNRTTTGIVFYISSESHLYRQQDFSIASKLIGYQTGKEPFFDDWINKDISSGKPLIKTVGEYSMALGNVEGEDCIYFVKGGLSKTR